MPWDPTFVSSSVLPGQHQASSPLLQAATKRSRRFSPTCRLSTAQTAVSTYTPSPFNPYPLANSQVQTILSHFYPPAPAVSYTRTLIPSDDGLASLHIDIAYATSLSPLDEPLVFNGSVPAHTPRKDYEGLPESQPVAVVLHGLESNAHSVVSKRIVAAVGAAGFKAAVLNYRSCGEGEGAPTTLRMYHAGFTEDLETLLRAIKEAAVGTGRQPPDVYLCGFSLGANIVSQFLGTRGEEAKDIFHVKAAAVACVPFDPTACQKVLDTGWKGVVYSSRLVQNMHEKFRAALANGADLMGCVPEEVERANRVGLIDETFIAPVFGFEDKFDYYRQVDSRMVLKNIAVPTLIINARDDPFFDHGCGRSLPTNEQIGDAPVLMHVTKYGGHCGFLDKAGFHQTADCYFQREFARFFVHVRGIDAVERSDPHNTRRRAGLESLLGSPDEVDKGTT